MRQRKKIKGTGKNKKNLMLKVSVGVVIISMTIFLIFMATAPLEVINLDVRFKVTDDNHIGPSINASALDFGKFFPGNSVTIKINMINNREFSVKANFFASENIVDLLEIRNTTIPPRNKLKVPVTLRIPNDMPPGNYSGKLKVVITKAEETE